MLLLVSITSLEISLAECLRHLNQRHCAHVELVLPDSAPWDQQWVEPLEDWIKVVGVADVWPISQWQPCWDVIWKGCVTLPPWVSGLDICSSMEQSFNTT